MAGISFIRTTAYSWKLLCTTLCRDDVGIDHGSTMRHASQINGREANEIILLNSHDGSSSYQMLAGLFRFVCSNGLVCGDTVADVRVPHTSDVAGQVVQGAFAVLLGFDPPLLGQAHHQRLELLRRQLQRGCSHRPTRPRKAAAVQLASFLRDVTHDADGSPHNVKTTAKLPRDVDLRS